MALGIGASHGARADGTPIGCRSQRGQSKKAGVAGERHSGANGDDYGEERDIARTDGSREYF